MTGPRSFALRPYTTTRHAHPVTAPTPPPPDHDHPTPDAGAAGHAAGPRSGRWLVRCADDPTGQDR